MNGWLTDNTLLYPFAPVTLTLVVRYLSGEYVTCSVMSVGVRSVRWEVLACSKLSTWQNGPRRPLRIRYVYVTYDLIDMLDETSWYLDDIFTIDNPEFEKHIPDIYPVDIQLNKVNI